MAHRERDLSNMMASFLNSGLAGLNIQQPPSQMNRSVGRIPIDTFSDEKSFTIIAELPGVKKEAISIDIYNNKLTLRVEKIREGQQGEINEIEYGKAERIITLPVNVTKPETVSTQYQNGVLRIRIDKLVEESNRFNVVVS